jgi:hypothetical protein
LASHREAQKTQNVVDLKILTSVRCALAILNHKDTKAQILLTLCLCAFVVKRYRPKLATMRS